MPILEFSRHLPLHDADWVSLQVGGDVKGEILQLNQHIKQTQNQFETKTQQRNTLPIIYDQGSQFRDFSHTAAAIASTDEVFTVDTAVAHLSGSMGHPMKLLISHPPDWRWASNSKNNHWYNKIEFVRI
jgi:hypothetical protein